MRETTNLYDLVSKLLAFRGPVEVKMSLHQSRDFLATHRAARPQYYCPDIRLVVRSSDRGPDWSRWVYQTREWRDYKP